MSPAAGRVFGILGPLAAFPRRIAAREVGRQGGEIRRGLGRATTDVVIGRGLLTCDTATIAARLEAARCSGERTLLSETAFLRLLGLAPAAPAGDVAREALIARSGLDAATLDRLTLFDAFEAGAAPFSFRDLILARKYQALLAGGADWAAIARSVHRHGTVAALTAKTFHLAANRAIYLEDSDGLSELDGQRLLGLGGTPADPDALFAAAEAAEAAGALEEAAELYRRCLAADPGDATAAFNRGNCLHAAGDADGAAEAYLRAVKRDPQFIEAWFNLAAVMSERGRSAAARRHLARAVALDPGYADAVYNLASLAFEAGDLGEARRLWLRYLELDPASPWARRAAQGVHFVEQSLAEQSLARDGAA